MNQRLKDAFHTVHHALQVEFRKDQGTPFPAESTSTVRRKQNLVDGCGESFRISGLDQKSCSAFPDHLTQAAHSSRDNGKPHGHRFQHHERKALIAAGKNQNIHAVKEPVNIVAVPEKMRTIFESEPLDFVLE